MNSGKDVRLVAMADIFEDRLQGSRQRITKIHPEQVAVADDHCFIGLDAYQKLIASGVDVVIVAGSSYFHPTHVKAAIAAGKHVFCEKPHGLDVPGVKSIMASAEEAKKKNLNFVSGLCWRFDRAVGEAMARIKDGAIGDIVAIQETYITSPYVCRPRQEGWSEMYYQLQNWYHFNWLSGDQTAQQLIHSLDKGSWAMGDVPPVKAWGMGGRQVCTDPKYGDQFDHHAVVFEYANGVRMYGLTRDIPGCFNETSDVIFGTKGRAILPRKPRIEGANPWQWEGELKPVMTDLEHVALFDAIRSGEDDQLRPLRHAELDAGHHGPDGVLHGPGSHLGKGHGIRTGIGPEGRLVRCRADRQARPRRHLCHASARHHQVVLSNLRE